MGESLLERLTQTPEGMRLFQQERTIQELTDLVCEVMKSQEITRAELARRLGKSKGYVTQLLDGRANMTLRTVSDLLVAMGRTVHFWDGPVAVAGAPLDGLTIEGAHWGVVDGQWPRAAMSEGPVILPMRMAS